MGRADHFEAMSCAQEELKRRKQLVISSSILRKVKTKNATMGEGNLNCKFKTFFYVLHSSVSDLKSGIALSSGEGLAPPLELRAIKSETEE